MSTKERNILLVAFLVLTVGFLLVYFFLGQRYQTALGQRDTLVNERTAKQSKLATINELRTPLKKLESSAADIDKVGLPKGEQLPDLIEQVEQLVLKPELAGIHLVSFQPTLSKTAAGGQNSSNGALESQFTLTVSGDPTKFPVFFDQINANVRPLTIKSITFSPGNNADIGSVFATISMAAYFQADTSATTTPAP